jgi:hypothetical protein
MEQSTIIETLKTSFLANVWVERRFIIYFILATIISLYAHGTLSQYLQVLLYFFLFVGFVFLGFVAILAHIKYFFGYERRREVELYEDKIVIKVNHQVTEQIFKNDIIKITLYDKRHIDQGNFYPTLVDSFYYLIVIDKNQKSVILTCLLDMKLKKKITAWYGKELEHIYQLFPFPYFNDFT